jgi:hypothetical protein
LRIRRISQVNRLEGDPAIDHQQHSQTPVGGYLGTSTSSTKVSNKVRALSSA